MNLNIKKFYPLLINVLGMCLIHNVEAATHNHCANNIVFNIGAGIYDITGPAAERTMMGYAMLDQKTAGILQRLWARAFVIESPCNQKRIVFVNADLGQVFQGIKQQVILKLQKKYGLLYDDRNVLITAIHTHSGPGGYSTYTLYNLSTFGFSRRNFDTIVNGIVAAIERAQNNMQEAHIKIAKGELTGINFNRSPQSYLLNPKSERDRYKGNTDTEMTLLRFDTLDGKPIGMLNWFPIHGVSMNNKNHLINGDNKGYAEYLFEKDFHSNYNQHAFVAAFAQANAGDVSPNRYGHEGGVGLRGILAVEQAGFPQYELAKKLYHHAHTFVKGAIDYRHTFVEMDKLIIDSHFTNGKPQRTCPAAIGISMLAGTQDGEGLGKQGVNCNTVKRVLPAFVCNMLTTTCQGVKPIAVQMGLMKPYPWVPNILPLQVFQLGNVVIGSVPFELTTMSGRRLKETIQQELPNKESHVLLSTLANAYVQYITTNEEYQLQRYEGGSTIFGPWSLAALQQQFSMLTKALIQHRTIATGPKPIDLSRFQVNLQPSVVFDDKPIGKQFGNLYRDVKKAYKPGQTVQAIFWGAHPKNNFRTQRTFLRIQELQNGIWQTIRQDRDWDTEYHWKREGLAYSLVTIVWRIPKEMKNGHYRIVHEGDWKSGWSQKIYPYVGYSSVFMIQK